MTKLEVLRASPGTESVEPAAVLIPTRFGPLRVDVLEVRQVELDRPSDDPGDRLHARAHAWANDLTSIVTIEMVTRDRVSFAVAARIAEPGPLIAMKLQAVMNRSGAKQGTDLLDVVRLTLDPVAGARSLEQLRTVDTEMAADIALHVDLWLVRRQRESLAAIRAVGGAEVVQDDLALTAELLLAAVRRPLP